MKTGQFRLSVLLTVVVATLMALPVAADDEASPSWEFYVAPSVFAAGVTGSLTTGGDTFPINPALSDLVDEVQPGGFVTFQGRKGRWGFVADLGFLSSKGVGSSDEPIEVELDNLIVEGDATYTPAEGLRFLFGFRAYDLSQMVTVPGSPRTESDTNVVDPIVGAMGEWNLGESWLFRIRGDVGGLGISSEMTYQGSLLFGYQFDERWDLHFGYRVFWYQIQKDSVQTNIRLSGLNVGFGYRF